MATQYYNAVAHTTTPFMTVYGQDGDVSSKLTDPVALPTGTGRGASWSPDNTYLAVAHTTSPFVSVYKRAGDVLTKIADPATLPTGNGYGASWSADGTYLTVSHTTSPFITVYKRAGDVLTKLADPVTLPPYFSFGNAWSADGIYLAVTTFYSPYIIIYKRSGDVLSKLSNPAALPSGYGRNAAWSPDGTYLSVVHAGSGYLVVYKRAGDVFTKIADPATLPTNVGQGTAWSPDGTYLSVAHTSSPFVSVYKRAGDVLTKIADPATLPTGNGRGTSWSPDGTYLSVVHNTSPFVTVYSRSGDVLSKVTNPASLPTGTSYGNAYSSSLNAAPTAPTWSAPADNSFNDIDSSLLLDWTFNDPDGGDTQSAYALSKSVDGGALSYWNAGTSAWGAGEIKNPTATTSVTLASSWAADGESIEYKVKTWDAADAVGPYGSGLTVNGAAATPPTITAPATSAVLASSSATVTWTVAAQAAYKIRVLSSVDAELFTTGKVTGAVTEVTLGYVFTDGQTGLKIELTTWNASDVPGVDTNTGISVDYTPPATPVLTVSANAAGYISVAIADPTPTGSQPTVVTHDIYVRVAAGGRQSGQRTVNDDGIRISTGTVPTNGTYLDYAAASGVAFEYRTLAVAGGATAYSAWT